MLGWALATFVKGMKIRLHKNWLSILAERRNCRWCDGFMINYDGYGLCCVWHGLCNHNFMNEWACIAFLITVGLQSVVSITWCGMVMVAVLLGICGEVTVHVVGWGGIGCRWLGRGQELGHVIHGTNPYPSELIRSSAISTLGDSSLS